MDIVLKHILILDSTSSWHGKTTDVHIVNGKIAAIGPNLNGKTLWQQPNAVLSRGFVDLRAALNDPGLEHKETLAQLEISAAKGGFTQVLTMPNTQPIIQSKEAINYVKSQGKLIDFLPAAALSKNTEGQDFTEMIDLANAGAVAFTDGEKPIYNADLLLKSLQYLGPLKKILINKPEDKHLALYGQVHEGLVSTQMGLKGIPALAETIMIDRDLKLLSYAQAADRNVALHFSCVSSSEAVEQIRKAKAAGLNITADTAAHYLMFTDTDVQYFDANFKVSPPFRSQADQDALVAGIKDGTIDAVVSDHRPHESDAKNLEFDHADFGAVGLETVLYTLVKKGLSLDLIEKTLISGPRKILNIAQNSIEIGADACLTVFSTEGTQDINEKWFTSPAKNSPFLNQTLKGAIYGIFNHGLTTLNP